MRDVTNSSGPEFQYKIKETFLFLIQFLKNPLREIGNLPDWSWKRLFAIQVILAVGSGVLSGLIPPNFYRVLAGVIIAPFVSTVMSLLMVLFLYYFFQIFEQKTVSIRKLMTLIVLSNTPFFIFEIGSELLPPITLLGFAMTSALMVIGLVENFELDRKKALRLVGAILLTVFVIWLWNRIQVARM